MCFRPLSPLARDTATLLQQSRTPLFFAAPPPQVTHCLQANPSASRHTAPKGSQRARASKYEVVFEHLGASSVAANAQVLMASVAPTEKPVVAEVVTKEPVSAPGVPIKTPAIPTAPDPFSPAAIAGYKARLPNSVQGFCDSIFYNDVVVERSIQDDLLPGEQVLADYNCFIPAKGIPLWKFTLYTILTAGLFYLYYYLEILCVKNKCWGRKFITMNRGRLCVTSKGRCLVWKADAEQSLVKENPFISCLGCFFGCCFRDLFAPPVNYTTATSAKAFRVDQVRDVKTFVVQQMPFLLKICCCSEKYTGSVRVHFDLFSNDVNDLQPVSSIPGSTFFVNKVKYDRDVEGHNLTFSSAPCPHVYLIVLHCERIETY